MSVRVPNRAKISLRRWSAGGWGLQMKNTLPSNSAPIEFLRSLVLRGLTGERDLTGEHTGESGAEWNG